MIIALTRGAGRDRLGHANAEIATRLHMSEATVKSHVSHLFDKFTVTNRVQLAIAAFRAGLVE